jgi:hypothetical protein
MGRKLDSYKFRIAEDEIDFEDLDGFRTFWRKHVTSLNKRDRELRDAINWDSMPPFRHVVGADGEPPYGEFWQKFSAGATYLNACFWKTRDDIVVLSGLCKRPIGIGNVVFALPAGYRPVKGHTFNCESPWSGIVCRVDVLQSGYVFHQSGGTVASRLSLAGITFPAEVI